jgi:hypothetical protein
MKEITTKTERLVMEDTGIVNIKALEPPINLEDAVENVDAVRILSGGKKVPIMVDITESKGVSREARAYLAGEETAKYQSACALIVGSPFSRLLGNFFLGLNKTKFPTRLFTEERSAREWLQTYL